MSHYCWMPGLLGYIGDDILPSSKGNIISHYKDPSKPTRIQWKGIQCFMLFFVWVNVPSLTFLDTR